MDLKLILFIFLVFYKTNQVISCQPPLQGFRGYGSSGLPSASQQYSYSQRYSQNYDNYNQLQASQTSAPTGQQSPTLVPPSFLQDTSFEEDNSLDQNTVVQTEVAPALTPPPDPPENPFGDSRQKPETENSSEDLMKLAEECTRTGVETLENFRKCTESYSYALTSKHAQFGSDKCDFEPEFVCRFYSAPHEIFSFKSGQFRVPPRSNRVFEETFAILTKRSVGSFPERTFIFVDVPHGTNENSAAVLRTDILCQNKDGRLSFDYWSNNPDLILKVCTRTDRERSCTQDISYDSESSRVEVDVIHPGDQIFAVEIVISNFVKPGIFILDNLEYEAELCEDASFNVESTTTTTFPQPRNIAFGSQLRSNPFPIENGGFQPLGNPTYSQGRPAYPVNPPIVRQEFQSYVTSFPQLVTTTAVPVTPKNPFGPDSPLNGVPSGNSRVPSSVISRPVGQPEITDGIAFVQNKYIQASRQSIVSKGIKKVSSCNILECIFNSDFCHYSQPEISSKGIRHGKWQISRSKIGNPLTGIKNEDSSDHGGFAFVGMDQHTAKMKGRTVYVLESPTFTLEADTLLSFDLYRRSNAITLQVCLDSLMNCPYEAPGLESTVYWREGESLIMPKKTKKVFFVATQWKRFKWLAIDNIVINKGRGCHGLQALRKPNL